MSGRRVSLVRRSVAIIGIFCAVFFVGASARAQTESETGDVGSGSADEVEGADEGTGARAVDQRRIRRLRLRGIILSAVGLSLTAGGATMSGFGFSEQEDPGDEVLRPLAVVFLGIGLALAGVGVSDLVASFLEDDSDEVETTSFLFHHSRAFVLARPFRRALF